MSKLKKVDNDQAEKLYRVLREYLTRDRDGQEVITAFEADPDTASAQLANHLRERLPQDEELANQLADALGSGGQFNTVVTGGHVDQIINIARLGVLNLTLKRYFYIFRDLKQLFGFLLVVLLAGAGISFGVWYVSQPKVMDGNFNIAVAQFGQVTDSGIVASAEAKKISTSLFNFLDSEFKASDFALDVQITHKNVPIIVEDREAERLAQRINADIVIYGSIYVQNNDAEVQPRFFVNHWPDTSELTGQHRLALPIPLKISQLFHEDDVNRILRSRATILLSFTQGLVSFAAKDLDAANYFFRQSVNQAEQYAEQRQTSSGQEVVYLFLGMVNLYQEDHEQAQIYLEKSLVLNPQYARAHIGLGNLYYVQYTQSWSDEEKWQLALDKYNEALESQDHPPGAYIREKVLVSLGNVYNVRAQQTNDPTMFDKAFNHYEQVVALYDRSKNERIKGLAATAHFGLGALYEKQENFTKAEEFYRSCIALTDDAQLVSRSQTQLSIIADRK